MCYSSGSWVIANPTPEKEFKEHNILSLKEILKNIKTELPKKSCTTLTSIPKGLDILLYCVHCSSSQNSQEVETVKCPSTDRILEKKNG